MFIDWNEDKLPMRTAVVKFRYLAPCTFTAKPFSQSLAAL